MMLSPSPGVVPWYSYFSSGFITLKRPFESYRERLPQQHKAPVFASPSSLARAQVCVAPTHAEMLALDKTINLCSKTNNAVPSETPVHTIPSPRQRVSHASARSSASFWICPQCSLVLCATSTTAVRACTQDRHHSAPQADTLKQCKQYLGHLASAIGMCFTSM